MNSTTNINNLISNINTNNYRMIKMTDIQPNPFQPRHIFDQAKLAELAQSIKKSGLYQPIILRQPIENIERYEIIAGERRFRASELAGLTAIPAIVKVFSDELAMEAAIIENLQREDLTALEEAKAYQNLMTELHLTQAQVSERLGKSRPYIANYLRLLGLPESVKQMLQAGKLSAGQARTLLGLKDTTLLQKIAQKTVQDGLTVRQLEEIVLQKNNALNSKKQIKRTKQKSTFIREIEVQLQDKLGAKAEIVANSSQKGKIEISYDTLADLNRLLDELDISID